jgi:hypothetical protein
VLASVERSVGAGPAGHGRSLASRRFRSLLAPSLAASRKTTHRFTLSRSDSTPGRGESPWDAPRIHGELLKLGIAVPERTVSRYLRGRPRARSQTWRTFFANHLGDRALVSPVMSLSVPGDDDLIDAGLSFRPVPLSLDGLCATNQWTVVDWPGSRRHALLGRRLAQDHVHDPTGARDRTGRGPLRRLRLHLASQRSGSGFQGYIGPRRPTTV